MSNSRLLVDEEDEEGIEFDILKRSSLELQENKNPKLISLEEMKATDDDGFKTPTSLDHKIPVMKQCPPAPRKPKPLPSNKRKPSASSSGANTCRILQIDFSIEVESLPPSRLLADMHRNVKKARKEDHQNKKF
ncbi:putative Pectinesterase-2 precursor [Hibiscus syriacus]|uniref:Pectinesterase-2 n=2 Tax=Hibiscus syriacus TaxID=106335 RepID=A0A6A3AMM1_HIBSY|nr:putative Pectinesterase-2 precursor [Hibiscus syriacus]